VQIELITTKDGSHSLYRSDLNEKYHSEFGAIQESMHIFIQKGFEAVNKKKIQIFELGFGTGLNALLTWMISKGKILQHRKVSFRNKTGCSIKLLFDSIT
jgi:tRNA U34 5-methylaminomethyl-2-thiouridine-forming methyltransferase MnmC